MQDTISTGSRTIPLVSIIRSGTRRRLLAFDRDENLASKEKRHSPVEVKGSGTGTAEIVKGSVVGRKELLGIGDAECHRSRSTVLSHVLGREAQGRRGAVED